MKLTIPEPKIKIGIDGFEKDLLNRSDLGRKFTELVDKMDGPLVLALDGGWGCGKSVFLKMWTGAHTKEFEGKSRIIYFDAFQHDFLDDPLTSLVSAISDHNSDESFAKSTITKVRKDAAFLAKPVSRIGLVVATSGISEVALPLADAATKKGAELLEDQISEFWNRADGKLKAMNDFTEALLELTKGDGPEGGQRVVFIVDELDRCRPDYALHFLEIIKHFFAVPNVHFVLGVNLESLQNSVKARYGQDIDAETYLKKFIHLTAKLPDSNIQSVETTNAVDYFSIIAEQNSIGPNTREVVVAQLKVLSKVRQLSLRDIERIYSKIVLLPDNFENSYWGYSAICTTALLLSVLESKIYSKILNGSISINDIGNFFGYSEGGIFEKPSGESENHRKLATYSIWSRVLHFSPEFDRDPEIVEFTRKAFGGFGSEVYPDTLKKYVTARLETWHLPEST